MSIKKAIPLSNEELLRYLEATFKITRKELLETIKFSRTSAEKISDYVKKVKVE